MSTVGIRNRGPVRQEGAILALLLGWAALAGAQNIPHAGYVLPAGGQRGTSFEIAVGGQFLQNTAEVFVSGKGIEAAVEDHARPMNGNEATTLRDRMQELQKLPMSDAVWKEMVDIRTKLVTYNYTRLTSPVLAETVRVRITISPDAAVGQRELRVGSPGGISNPLVFCVSDLPEVREKEEIAVTQPAGNARNMNQLQIAQPPTDMAITLPAVVNGRIKPRLARAQGARAGQPFTPGERDRYRFQAKQGQNLVIAASARELMPYLADAVPGWFQAVLTVYDPAGKEVAYDDDFRFHPDPVLHYVVPRDGEYSVEIKDALYRGREDFVYRITIGEVPYVTGIFPLGGPAGKRTSVELAGWNLPEKRVTFDGAGKAPGVYQVAGQPFQVDTLPETGETAKTVKLPAIVNGRIEKPGEWKTVRFEGRAGERIAAEVYARRLESPLDSVLRLTDAAGKEIAFNDDAPDASAGLETHHADSRILVTLPANGSYALSIGDAQQKGGAEYAYRLRIGAPRPDFELRVTPSAVNAGVNASVPLTVHAIRRDGFAGEIALELKDAPRGYVLTGGVIPAGADQARVTLTAPPPIQREPRPLEIAGRARIDGNDVTHTAVAAEDMMQAFFYRHLVAEGEGEIAVRRGAALRTPARVVGTETLQIAPGQTVRLRVAAALPPNSPLSNLRFELDDPPEGIAIQETTAVPGGAEIVLRCDAAKAKPGLRGNLIIDLSAERTPPATKAQPAGAKQRVALGSLPALPFQIAGAVAAAK